MTLGTLGSYTARNTKLSNDSLTEFRFTFIVLYFIAPSSQHECGPLLILTFACLRKEPDARGGRRVGES